ncbi:MAG TPA: ADP-ribosylation factor-like protein, partial [Polyangiaceae bacterium]|nr:ADP-ribosylation factor-like protein [Polyangiaceae bacterium]
MPVFDKAADRIVVHVVYDGPAFAGKTTNLEQLCTFFTEHRRSELFTTQNAGERTVYLDWLQLEGGVVAGKKLRCQMIAVPGQTVLARRRWHLLKRADVVVFVVEATLQGIEVARPMFDMVSSYCRELDRDLPLVVQANKSDLPGALSVDVIAQALGCDRARVVSAQANVGHGVRETVVIAIRAAANVVQGRVLAEGLDALEGQVTHGREIQAEMEREEQENPQSPISIMLEHGVDQRPPDSEARAPSPAPAPIAAPTPAATPIAESSRSSAPAVPAPVIPTRDTLPTGMAPDEPPVAALIDVAPGLALGGTLPRIVPPLPQPAVASGFIWPAATGRELLRSVPLGCATLRAEAASAEVQATPRSFVFDAGSWCLRTSSERWFSGSEQARDALLALVRRKICLGPLLVSDTVLTLQSDPQGGYWLWTVMPGLPTLDTVLRENAEEASRVDETLAAYAAAALTTLRYAVRHEVLLALHPANFAVARG